MCLSVDWVGVAICHILYGIFDAVRIYMNFEYVFVDFFAVEITF